MGRLGCAVDAAGDGFCAACAGDEEDKPLDLEIIAPKKPKAKPPEPKREKVGVGAKKDDDGEPGPEGETPDGAGNTES